MAACNFAATAAMSATPVKSGVTLRVAPLTTIEKPRVAAKAAHSVASG